MKAVTHLDQSNSLGEALTVDYPSWVEWDQAAWVQVAEEPEAGLVETMVHMVGSMVHYDVA